MSKIIVFGSYVRADLNEGDFKNKFHKRIAGVLGLTDLPIEPLCYTEDEFRKMRLNKNDFISEVLKEGVTI